MFEEAEHTLSTHRRRRGVAKASITHLSNCLKELEADLSQPAITDHAQKLEQKLDALDAEFRSHHHNIVDLTDSEESLEREQTVLGDHDDLVTKLSVRITQLIDACTSSDTALRKLATRRLAHVRKALTDATSSIKALMGDADDAYRLRQYEEQVLDLKKELSKTRSSLLTLELQGVVTPIDEIVRAKPGVKKRSQRLSRFSFTVTQPQRFHGRVTGSHSPDTHNIISMRKEVGVEISFSCQKQE